MRGTYARRPYAAEQIMAWAQRQPGFPRQVPPEIRPFGATSAPAPATRPTGIPAPSGDRPLPGSTAQPGTDASSGTSGGINPWYVGLAVTLGVMAAMVIWE